VNKTHNAAGRHIYRYFCATVINLKPVKEHRVTQSMPGRNGNILNTCGDKQMIRQAKSIDKNVSPVKIKYFVSV